MATGLLGPIPTKRRARPNKRKRAKRRERAWNEITSGEFTSLLGGYREKVQSGTRDVRVGLLEE